MIRLFPVYCPTGKAGTLIVESDFTGQLALQSEHFALR